MTGDRLNPKLIRAADTFDAREAQDAAQKGVAPTVREHFGYVAFLRERYRGRWAKILGALKTAFPDLDVSGDGYASSTEERLKKAFHQERQARDRRARARAPVVALAMAQPAFQPAQLTDPSSELHRHQAIEPPRASLQPEDGAFSDPDLEALKRQLSEDTG